MGPCLSNPLAARNGHGNASLNEKVREVPQEQNNIDVLVAVVMRKQKETPQDKGLIQDDPEYLGLMERQTQIEHQLLHATRVGNETERLKFQEELTILEASTKYQIGMGRWRKQE